MKRSFCLRLALCTALILSAVVSTTVAQAAQPTASGSRDGYYSVLDFGAKGDGKTDDTGAFQNAVAKASSRAGYVTVPPVGPGRGYVLTRTIRLPKGVSLIGSPAGFGNNSWAAFDLPDKNVHGAKIFARPQASEYTGQKKRPLFLLEGGNTVRGLCILYDRQPWPTDQEFKNPRSPYYYPSFDKAKASFIRDHVKPCGPTFYLPPAGANWVIEDIICDRYYDFFFQAADGKSVVNRVYLYGYRRGFVIKEAFDVNRMSSIHLCPNVGPACPGDVGGGKSYSWIYGVVVSQPDCVGIQMGRSDGYSFRDLFFFGVHTGIRFGASAAYPLYDPVTGANCYYDPSSDVLHGFGAAYKKGGGPWGSISTFSADCCNIGIHFVWPANNCTCMLTNACIGTAFDDGRRFPTQKATGKLDGIPMQAAFVVEPTFSSANSSGKPTFLCSNAEIVSYSPTSSFAAASAHAGECNGRAFLIAGDMRAEFSNFTSHWPYDADQLYAAGDHAGSFSIRIRGLLQADEPTPDLVINEKGLNWQGTTH